jgi:hypothetical protein
MKYLLPALFVFIHAVGYSQITVSGYIEDKNTKERLPGVNVYDIDRRQGTVSNSYGFYSISLKNDTARLLFSTVGYQQQVSQIHPREKEINLNIELESGIDLAEVVVTHKQKTFNNTEMSVLKIPVKQLLQTPALMGEADIMRAFQLMPGVQGGKEGTSGIYVRGGSPDQNLMLLDDIPLYYVNHIGGYVSVFNPEVIKDIKLYKGGFPARYGGRLSSIVDIRMKEGNMNDISGNVSVGIISSKFSVEGPIKKDKTSFIFSARRSLFDVFTRAYQKLILNDNASAGYTLYDMNAKINHIFDSKNRLYFSTYFGRDRILIKQKDFDTSDGYPYNFKSKNDVNWGNYSMSLRWNRIYSSKLFSNFTIGYTNFFYRSFSDIDNIEKQTGHTVGTLSNHFSSAINDFIAKADFDFYKSNHQIKFGGGITKHRFTPTMNNIYQIGANSGNIDTTFGAPTNKPTELFLYSEDEFTLTENLLLNVGLHFSTLTENKHTFYSLQPRITGNYAIAENYSIKASFSRMMQPFHLLSNNDAGLPTDLWVPATKEVPPQKSSQFALGFAGEINPQHPFEWSIEAFYKKMNNLIEFADGASFFSGVADWKEKIVKNGNGTVYGSEFLLQKKEGTTTGWISYTLSKNMRQFDGLNLGNLFPYKYDRRHDFSIFISHKFNDKFQLSSSWVFASGNAVTLPSNKYNLYVMGWENRDEGSIIYFYDEAHIYNERNNYRTPSYHRLDISLDITERKRNGLRIWTLGLYNAYNRLNTYYLYFDKDKAGNKKLYSFSLFPVIPSISYKYYF